LAALLLVAAFGSGATAAQAQSVMQWSQPELVAEESGPLLTGASDISCASAMLCVAVGKEGRFLYSTEPTAGIEAWRETQVTDPDPADLISVSCSSSDFCAAVDKAGNVFVSHEPEEGAWIKIAIGDGHPLTDISCSSATFCVAVDAGGDVFVSEDPGAGAGAWEATELDEEDELLSVSCAGPSLCVVVGDEESFSSTEPAAGVWNPVGLQNLREVSCSDPSFCAATTLITGALVSEEPDGGAGTWVQSPGSDAVGGPISCPDESFCATVDLMGSVMTSSDPAGSDPGWESSALRPVAGDVMAISCPSSDFCAAVLDTGAVFTSTDPDGGPEAWDYTATGAWDPALTSVSCPTGSLCLAAGPRGTLYASMDPTLPGSWSGARITEGRLDQVSCARVNWCIARGYNRTLLYSEEPTHGVAAWSSVSMPFALDLACPTESFCAAVDGSGNVLISTEPLGGAGAWITTDLELPDWRLGRNEPKEISCPSAGFCVVGGDVGMVAVSEEPTGGTAAWSKTFVGNPEDFYNGAGPNIDGLDCPSASFCTASMWSGTIAASTEPAGGATAWIHKRADGSFFSAVSCSLHGEVCVAASRLGETFSAFDLAAAGSAWSAPEPFPHEGLEDVSCEPGGSFCLVVDDEGYVTTGEVEEESIWTGPVQIRMPPSELPPRTPIVPAPRSRCKAKKTSHGRRAGKLAIGPAVALSSVGRHARTRCGRLR
jgi:hypothetical protein